MEIWKDIEGYENKYQVSNLGRIKSLKNRYGYREKILNPPLTKKGYKRITLTLNGKKKNYMIHRLVAQAFIPNPNNLPQVNHIDGNKTNNRVNNLEWCTNGENQIHAWKNGLNKGATGMFLGANNPRSKKVLCVTTGEEFGSIREVTRVYGIDRHDIVRCCNGSSKSAGKHPVTGEKMVWEWR